MICAGCSTDLLIVLHLVDVAGATAGFRALEIPLTGDYVGVLPIERVAGIHTYLVTAFLIIYLASASLHAHVVIIATNKFVGDRACSVAAGVFTVNHLVVILVGACRHTFEVRVTADHVCVFLIHFCVARCRADLLTVLLFVGLAIAGLHTFAFVTAADKCVFAWTFCHIAVCLAVLRNPVTVLVFAGSCAFEVCAIVDVSFLIIVTIAGCRAYLLIVLHSVCMASATAASITLEVSLTLDHRGVFPIERIAGVNADFETVLHLIDLASTGFQTFMTILTANEGVLVWTVIVVAVGIFTISYPVIACTGTLSCAFEVRVSTSYRIVFLINFGITGWSADLPTAGILTVNLIIAAVSALEVRLAGDYGSILLVELTARCDTKVLAVLYRIGLAVAGFQAHTVVLTADKCVAGWTGSIAVGLFAINNFVVRVDGTSRCALKVRLAADHVSVL